MNPLFLDFETRSPADIKKVGAHVYAHHPGTEVSCTGWALAEGDVEVAAGFPSYLRASLLDPEVVLVAHNAAFEREVLAAKLDIHIPWSRIIDTAALAARMAMPRKLEALAIALKLDQQKDMQGHRVMLKLARPKGGWDDEDVEFWDESEKPEDFEALRDYCRQDVAVMRECYRRLLPLSTDEARLYAITGKMNDAGVKVDLESIPPALELLNAAIAEGETEFKAITGGHGVKSYKNVALALGLENVKKPTVRKALRNEATPPRVRRALELFQKLARSSPAKLTALQRRTSVDGRVRGALIYSGAERTQRWSSGGVQLHNLPRGLGEATDEAFRALACGVLDICYDDPVGTIAEALRGFFVGPYIVGDFAQIEARTLNWLAGQKDVLDIFAVNGDVYSHTATKIFGRPITKKSTDDSLPDGVTPRFVGKTVELGCGYGLGWEKFHRQMDEVFDVQITPDLAMRSVYTYRESHPRVVALWKRLEQAFAYVVQKNAPRVNVQPDSLPPIAMGNVVVGGLRYAYIELPSGRRLYYSEPEMTADGVRYWGRNIYAGGKWDRVSTYGGKIAENITQATSRDVLAYSMLKLDEAGFKLVLQVHDEVVAEVGDNDNLTDKFRMLMMQTPAWASGLPVDVEVFSSHRYRK